MKNIFKKILSLLLCVLMLSLVILGAVSCATPNTPTCTHRDADDNNICDECGDPFSDGVDKKPSGENQDPQKSTYTVSIKSYGGLALDGVRLYIHEENDINSPTIARATTDKNGIATLELPASDNYYIELENYPLGYVASDLYKMDTTGKSIMLMSKPIDPDEEEIWDVKKYELGDVIHDFTITDLNGVEHTVSDVLKEKSLLVLNFWYAGCTNCDAEFPYLSSAYDKYSSKMELFAINDYAGETINDALNHIIQDKDGNIIEPNFPKFFLDVASDPDLFLLDKFGSTGYPTTVMIDRYGVICMIEIGGIPSEKPFVKAFEHFTSDNYEQRIIESIDDLNPPIIPNVDMPSSEEMSEVLDGGLLDVTYSADDSDEYAWPFVITTKDGVSCVKPSNFDQDGSYAALLCKVYLKAGEALVFDYLSSTEKTDIFVVTVDGKDIYTITGVDSDGEWDTCCTWVAETDGYYDVNFVYAKDLAGYEGDDAVYIKDLRIISEEDVPVKTYIFRFAAVSNNGQYTYADIYYNENDGYYHVGSENGPLLLVDMLGNYTQFEMLQANRKTMFERLYGITNKDDNDMPIFMVGGKNVFASLENYGTYSVHSDISGCIPVTKELKDMLVAYADMFRNEVGKPANDNLWLQLCCYYSAYGPDVKQLEDPIKGLAPFSPFIAVEGEENVITYNKIIVPRGLLYKFVPTISGVYRVTSRANSLTGIVGWIFAANTDNPHTEWAEEGGRSNPIFHLTTNEIHYERYSPELLIIDHYVVECPECGTSVTVAENATSATCTNSNCGATITDMSGITPIYSIDRRNISMTAYLEAGKSYYISLAYHTVEELGTFSFDLDYVGESFDRFISTSPGSHTVELLPDGSFGNIIHGGVDAQLCHLDNCAECEYAATTLGDPVGTKYYHHIKSKGSLVGEGYYGGSLALQKRLPFVGFASLSYKAIADTYNGTEVVGDSTYYYTVMLEEDGTGNISITTAIGESIIDLQITSYTFEGENIVATYKNYAGSQEVVSGELTLSVSEGKLGSLIYADFYMPTSIFTDSGLNALVDFKTHNQENELVYLFGEYREIIRNYVENKMLNEADYPERQGCIPVSEELATILQYVMDTSVFEDVYQSWLKLCYYYDSLGQ